MSLPAEVEPFVALFGESGARAVVSVQAGDEAEFGRLCERAGVPATRIGTVGAGGEDAALVVEGEFEVPLAELRATWTATLPGLYEES